MISHFYKSRRNVIIVQDDEERGFNRKQVVDVWWGGLKGNGGLMMILSYLLKNSLQWKQAEIRLKIVVPSEEAAEKAEANLSAMLAKMRVGFQFHILVSKGESFWDILSRESAASDMVMMGLAIPEGDFNAYYSQLKERTRRLPTKVFVLAAQDIEFEEVLS